MEEGGRGPPVPVRKEGVHCLPFPIPISCFPFLLCFYLGAFIYLFIIIYCTVLLRVIRIERGQGELLIRQEHISRSCVDYRLPQATSIDDFLPVYLRRSTGPHHPFSSKAWRLRVFFFHCTVS